MQKHRFPDTHDTAWLIHAKVRYICAVLLMSATTATVPGQTSSAVANSALEENKVGEESPVMTVTPPPSRAKAKRCDGYFTETPDGYAALEDPALSPEELQAAFAKAAQSSQADR
ncbi:hypothetical protein CYMTET_32920 [Cymbomonas tetramitiformis]|uniref:Uncharacterized protein n=1 Tax=Cymbomonas tetramitiformis TaxID=36881 RepID=A0AAE0KRD6_9CHLO|nr:hypothetical protein CYMTET_32920 [Cymbomonas tetramitiformis]